MKDWMDLDGDGKIDSTEMMFAEEMLCTSREEHKALFGWMLWQQDLILVN